MSEMVSFRAHEILKHNIQTRQTGNEAKPDKSQTKQINGTRLSINSPNKQHKDSDINHLAGRILDVNEEAEPLVSYYDDDRTNDTKE